MAALYSALTLVDLYPTFGAELQSCASCVRGFSAAFGAHVLSTEFSSAAAPTDIRPSEAQQPPRVSVIPPACVQSLLASPGEMLPPRYYTRKCGECQLFYFHVVVFFYFCLLLPLKPPSYKNC